MKLPALHWWATNTTDSQLPYLRWFTTGAWLLACTLGLHHIVEGNVLRVSMSVGYLLLLTPLMLGPQCWAIFDVPEGSTTRRVFTAFVLLGFLLALSALFAEVALR